MTKVQKLLFKDLPNHNIEKIIFCSIEQALYQAFVVIDGEERLVWEDDKRCCRSQNLMEFRKLFEPLNIPESFLRHDSPYDEMIGHSHEGDNNRLEVPLGKNPYARASWLQ